MTSEENNKEINPVYEEGDFVVYPKVKKVMWSRRAQEYETKINSGNLIWVAEVVRDLHRGENQAEQSYSERQMYQAALERLAGEFAAIEDIDKDSAASKLEGIMTAA